MAGLPGDFADHALNFADDERVCDIHRRADTMDAVARAQPELLSRSNSWSLPEAEPPLRR
jgi:hypothetical protein